MMIERVSPEKVVVKFQENPDHAQVQEWTDHFKSQLNGQEKEAVVDLTALKVVSSLGVNVILGFHKKLESQGGKIRVLVSSETVGRVFELFKLNQVFSVEISHGVAGK
jgi:anti-anti-sigma factor